MLIGDQESARHRRVTAEQLIDGPRCSILHRRERAIRLRRIYSSLSTLMRASRRQPDERTASENQREAAKSCISANEGGYGTRCSDGNHQPRAAAKSRQQSNRERSVSKSDERQLSTREVAGLYIAGFVKLTRATKRATVLPLRSPSAGGFALARSIR